MISIGGRTFGRLPQLRLRCLGGHRPGLSSPNIERVAALYNAFHTQHFFDLILRSSLLTPNFRRTYADRPVSRPKAHTGRTTAAARKAPTTSKTKAAKKPAPKKKKPKATPKSKSKAKPRIKPKPTSAKKAKAKPKPKPKPKPKKPRTEKQKNAATVKQLKALALKPPTRLPDSAWTLILFESVRGAGVASRDDFSNVSKAASVQYKELTPERLEHYNHIANQNKAANATAYRKWIESHTPLEIRKANNARHNLKRRGQKGIFTTLQDHRRVKRNRNAYTLFHTDRFASGDYKGLKLAEATKLIGREWKALSASEKKPYEETAKQDMARYIQEMKTVYDRDVVHARRSAA